MMLRGAETHVLDDGTEHLADECPDGCAVRAGLERLLAELDAGRLVARRVS